MFGLIKNSFTAIKGLFSSNPGEITDIAKGVGGWIDEQQFTEQEKSEAGLKVLDWKLKWINATRGMNLARRYLAILFAVNFLIAFQVCIISVVAGTFLDFEVDEMIESIIGVVSAFQIGWAMVTILVFYFGKGMVESATNKKAP